MKVKLSITALCAVCSYAQITGYTPSTNTGAALQTAINSVPSTGGTVWVPAATYSFSTTTVTVAAAQNKVQIRCEPGAIFTYTGSGAAFQVGGDLSNTEYFRMEGCEISLVGNSNSSAVGLKLIRSFWANVKDVKVMSDNNDANPSQTAVMVSGGDGCSGAPGCGSPSQAGFSAYNIFENVAIIGSWLTGFHFNSEISGGPSSRDRSNRNTIIGGSVYTSAQSKTNTVAIKIEHGDTNHVLNTDIDSFDIGVQVDGHNNHISAKCEGPTVVSYCVDVTANSQGTFVIGVNVASGKFRDNGYETQYIIASQAGVNKSLLNDVSVRNGFTLVPQASAPGTLTNGMMWYDSTAGRFKCRQGGATINCTP